MLPRTSRASGRAKSPVRIVEEELVSGSATLFDATKHLIPVTYNGKHDYWSISHLTIDYKTTLDNGIDY